jgi:3-oxoacyl-[acyl-carrier-protein] synthase II
LLKFLPNMLACHVTIVHDAQAPSNTLTCGEASSHLAIGEAFRTIARGDADVCICGGAEAKVNPMAVTRPLLLGRLNTEEADQAAPEGACRPFGADRRGTVVAEGGGLVILEAMDHARSRGARIYGEIVGFGAGTNCQSWREPEPDGRAMRLSLQKALSDAGIEPKDVGLVNPFGVGSLAHDAAEMAAWNDVFGAHLDRVPAVTTRGANGNCGAGSGAIDLAATILCMHRHAVVPSVNTGRLAEGCGFRFVQTDPKDARIDHAISVGPALAGGQCAALVVRRWME